MSIRVSVIIVAYNNRQDLERCLPSLYDSDGSAVEILLVDNASSDGTAEWVRGAHPSIRLVRSESNLGFGGGSNLGARMAHGQYLVFLNPDTTVSPGWWQALIGALDKDPAVGLATSKILLMQSPQYINTCGNDVHISGITLCRGMGQSSEAFSRQEEVGAVSGAAFAIRSELFETLCGFDESFFMYMEDTDLSLRARLLGYRCVCVPDSIVYHRYTLRFGPRKTFYQERNRYLMILKCLRRPTL
jgi:GT2 family glycosyltransferase